MTVLVVDGANVVGARPDGWWKDRAGAARRLHEQLVTADLDEKITEVVLVLEGEAKSGVRKGRDGHVTVVHAPQDGDSEIVRQAHQAADAGTDVTRRDRRPAARRPGRQGRPTVGPTWLLDRLGGPHSAYRRQSARSVVTTADSACQFVAPCAAGVRRAPRPG